MDTSSEQPPVRLPPNERLELLDITNLRAEGTETALRLNTVAKERAAVLDEVN